MEPVTPLSRRLQGCTDHTSGARMPPKFAFLNGSVMTIRLGKSGTLINKEGALEKIFLPSRRHGDFPSCEGCTSRNSAEGQQQLRSGEHLFCTAGGQRQVACPHLSVTPAWGKERALSELLLPWAARPDLPQRGMLSAREGEPECLLGSWHSLSSCSPAW